MTPCSYFFLELLYSVLVHYLMLDLALVVLIGAFVCSALDGTFAFLTFTSLSLAVLFYSVFSTLNIVSRIIARVATLAAVVVALRILGATTSTAVLAIPEIATKTNLEDAPMPRTPKPASRDSRLSLLSPPKN